MSEGLYFYSHAFPFFLFRRQVPVLRTFAVINEHHMSN